MARKLFGWGYDDLDVSFKLRDKFGNEYIGTASKYTVRNYCEAHISELIAAEVVVSKPIKSTWVLRGKVWVSFSANYMTDASDKCIWYGKYQSQF